MEQDLPLLIILDDNPASNQKTPPILFTQEATCRQQSECGTQGSDTLGGYKRAIPLSPITDYYTKLSLLNTFQDYSTYKV